MKTTLVTSLLTALSLTAAWAQSSAWTPPTEGTYSSSTVIYVEPKLNGYAMSGSITIAAFIDGECRGVATELEQMGSTSRYYMELSVAGDPSVDAGKTIEFQATDGNVDYTITKTATWSENGEYGYPFEINFRNERYITALSLPESFTIDSETSETVDLLEHLEFTIGGTKYKASEIDAYPTLVWSNVESASNISVSAEGVVTALLPTQLSGVPVSVTCRTREASTMIKVTPLQPELQSIELPEYIDVAIGASIDIRDYLTFVYKTGTDAVTGEDVTVSKAYSELDEAPAVMLYDTSNEYISCSPEAYTITGVASTDINGTPVSVSAAGMGARGRVRVTPISYEVVSLAWNTESLELDLNGTNTADLYDYLDFTVVEYGFDAEGQPLTVVKTAADIADLDIEFVASGDEVELSDGFLTAVARTSAEGVKITALYSAEVKTPTDLVVVVTPVIVSLTSLQLSIPSAEMPRGTTQSFGVTLEPANAEFDPSLLTFSVHNIYTNDYASAGWTELSLDATSEDGLTWLLGANCVGCYEVTALYDGEQMATSTVNVGAPYSVAAGWNWVSYYITAMNLSTPAEVSANLYELTDMRSQTQTTFYDEEFGFYGSLKTIDHIAYRVKATEGADVTVYPIRNFVELTYPEQQVYAGWTWMYYPYQCAFSINDVNNNGMMSGVTFSNGDKLISKDGGFAEYNTNKWVASGTFSLQPGQSYLLQTANAGQLTWKPEQQLPQPEASSSATPAPARRNWQYDAAQWQQNMVVVGRIEGEDNNVEVGAMVNGECRGESQIVDFEGQRYFFITVHGEAGETVSFCTYDGDEYQMLDLRLDFQPAVGTLSQPVTLGYREGTNGISQLSQDAEGAELYDLSGRRTQGMQQGIYLMRQGGVTRKMAR